MKAKDCLIVKEYVDRRKAKIFLKSITSKYNITAAELAEEMCIAKSYAYNILSGWSSISADKFKQVVASLWAIQRREDDKNNKNKKS